MSKQKSKPLTANEIAQPIFHEMSRLVQPLSKEQAIEVLEEIADHASVMAEGLQAEIDDETNLRHDSP